MEAWRSEPESWIGRILFSAWEVDHQLARTVAEMPPGAKICDLGASGRKVRPDAFTVDIDAGPLIDLVADVHALPIEDERFDLVICTGVLNHCHDPIAVSREVARILKKGGLAHLEAPMCQPLLPHPVDYWRLTLPGLVELARRAGLTEVVRKGVHMGPWTALTSNALYTGSKLLEGGGLARKLARGALHAALGPLKYLDALHDKASLAELPAAYATYVVARKAA